MQNKPLKNLLLIVLLTVSPSCSAPLSNSTAEFHPDSDYFFSIFGDSRGGHEVYASLLSAATFLRNPNAILHLGDIIANPDRPSQYLILREINARLLDDSIAFLPIPGNHDVNDTASLQRYFAAFPELDEAAFYARQLDDCYCIFLNSEDPDNSDGLGVEQLAWLEAELQRAQSQTDKMILVAIHRPLFPQNHHRDQPLPGRDELHQLLVQYGVDLVLSGHEHSYSATERDGVHYLISGGAGSPLYSQAGAKSAFFHYIRLEKLRDRRQFLVSAIGITGILYDSFTIDY